MSFRSMNTLPDYAPSQAFGEYFVPNGMGEYFTPQPMNGLGAFTQAAAGITGLGNLNSPCPMGMCGLGAEGDDVVNDIEQQRNVTISLGIGGAILGAVALGGWIYMGYKIGQDLSPVGRNWGTGGALMSLLGPFAHWGYGIMALSNGR